MKSDELISKLQEIQKTYGELPVLMDIDNEYGDGEITTVSYDSTKPLEIKIILK